MGRTTNSVLSANQDPNCRANTTLLRYYDRNLPVTVQGDASLRGLGACLIQIHQGKDQPIAFASKSLTDAETRYANIERELLAIVFACQRFSTYLLGRSFIAESDHKLLEMIAMKNLANAPPRLQGMLLELQKYDVTIKYRPGGEMQLANALSRCPARASQEIKLDMRVDYIAFMKPWIEKLKDSTQRDPILATVYQLTQQGWPHQRRHVPCLARCTVSLSLCADLERILRRFYVFAEEPCKSTTTTSEPCSPVFKEAQPRPSKHSK